jgi:hypothetical protein
MARAAGLRYVQLAPEIDLSSDEPSHAYGEAVVPISGATASDTAIMRGAPIRYAFSIPVRAANPDLGLRFAVFLLSEPGKAALSGEYLTTLSRAEAEGADLPDVIAALTDTSAQRVRR